LPQAAMTGSPAFTKFADTSRIEVPSGTFWLE
jgi:hypothetical protein